MRSNSVDLREKRKLLYNFTVCFIHGPISDIHVYAEEMGQLKYIRAQVFHS